jgi:hypothetical protein
VNNACYFRGHALVVEMNLVAYSGRDDRGSHVPVLRDLSGVVRGKLEVVLDVVNFHFVAVSHRKFDAKSNRMRIPFRPTFRAASLLSHFVPQKGSPELCL